MPGNIQCKCQTAPTLDQQHRAESVDRLTLESDMLALDESEHGEGTRRGDQEQKATRSVTPQVRGVGEGAWQRQILN